MIPPVGGPLAGSSLVACFSGGKDSTAMVLLMHEQGLTITGLLVTPTGNELAEVWEHWDRVAELVGAPTIRPKGPTLAQMIGHYAALPNFRQRWCTRTIKIQPAIAWAMRNPSAVLCVGLRADEEERKGIISTSVPSRFPLREAGYGIPEVRAIIARHGLTVPRRTDCAICYHQSIGEWWDLWDLHSEQWAQGLAWEKQTGHTFRSPGRDSWPVSMLGLGEAFAAGREPTKVQLRRQLPLFDEDGQAACRVCSL